MSGTVTFEGPSERYSGPAAAGAGNRVIGARPEHLTVTAPDQGLPGVVRMVEMLGAEQILHIDFDGLIHYDPDGDDSEGAARHLHVFDATKGLARHDWIR